MLDELGLRSGVLLFRHFRIPGESLDEGLVTLMRDEDVLTLLKYVPKFIEIDVYMEEYVSLVEQHRTEVMNEKGKVHGLVKVKRKNYIADALAFRDILRNIDFEFRNESDIMKKKVSQDSVIVEEVIEDMHYNLDKFVENLNHSQDALEILSGMEGDFLTWMEDSDDTISDTEGDESDLQRFFDYDDASISGLSSDFSTWVSDDDVSINGMEGDWMLDSYHNVIDPLVYEDVGDEDVVEQLTDSFVYEEFENKDGVQHATDPVVNANVREIEGAKSFGYVISESIKKRKRSDQDDVYCGYALIGSQSKRKRLNDEEVGGKDIIDDVP
ncbi:hypothetical protein Tco_0727732 [Tanacetum coccineum]|uniref:Uncharacterized protein n=1 Tax=Tanacetum coccineum TaxID=301880 RepID=A0ABQ4YLH3_9ASTR